MIIQSALDWALRNKITPEVIAEVYNDPSFTYTDPVHEHNERRVRGPWCLVIDPNGVILSVLPSAQAQVPYPEIDDIKVPVAKGGKGGSLYPTDFDEVRKLLVKRGYRVEDSKGGHKLVMKGEEVVYSMPSTPSDYRGIKNALADMKKVGIDLKREP